MTTSPTPAPRDTVGLNPTGRSRRSSAASRRKADRRNLAAAVKLTGGAK